MNAGLYEALAGNLSAMRRLDVISNNLANASTSGYKADRLEFEAVLGNAKDRGKSPITSETFSIDFSVGPMQKTDNALDVALDGEGFFAVNTPDGIAYTRQGNFHRGADGKLVTAEGYEVQGGNGAIVLKGGRIEINAAGGVTVDGASAGTLAPVDFPKPYALTKVGNALLVPADPQAAPTAATAQVRQGFVEGANVKVIAEMARMIENSRYFESCVRAVRNYDDITARAANDLGKV
jgi:flagellar basal-body rod protein FlgF